MGKLSDIIDGRLKELGIPGSKMCDDLGMSRSTLTELRKGRATTLKAEKASAIASYLGLSVEELLGKEKPPTPKSGRSSDPDIRKLERAKLRMPEKEWKHQMEVFAASLGDYFSDDYEDDDLDE